MRIYSNIITADDLVNTARQVPGFFIDTLTTMRGARVRNKGYHVSASGNTKRWKNSGVYGAERKHSASYDQHGHWFNILYLMDPNAQICYYTSADDFHKKTNNKYRTI